MMKKTPAIRTARDHVVISGNEIHGPWDWRNLDGPTTCVGRGVDRRELVEERAKAAAWGALILMGFSAERAEEALWAGGPGGSVEDRVNHALGYTGGIAIDE